MGTVMNNIHLNVGGCVLGRGFVAVVVMLRGSALSKLWDLCIGARNR